MKTKSGFLLRNIAGNCVVVPVGERVAEFNGIITLNDTGAFLWKELEKGAEVEDLVRALLANYEDVDEETARQCVKDFLTSLQGADCLE